jgi:hypothetical protein
MAWCGWAHSAWMSPQEMQKGRGARTGTKRGKEIPRGWTNWDGTCPTLGKSMCPEPQDSLERWKVNESDKSHSSSGKIGFLSCWGSLLRSSWAHPSFCINKLPQNVAETSSFGISYLRFLQTPPEPILGTWSSGVWGAFALATPSWFGFWVIHSPLWWSSYQRKLKSQMGSHHYFLKQCKYPNTHIGSHRYSKEGWSQW